MLIQLEKKQKEYIRNQLKEDAEQMQLAIEFPDDPLNG